MKKNTGGYSLYVTLLSAILICALAILLFLLTTLSPRVSGLIRTNAVDRISETVQQSAAGFVQYTDSLQDTMQFALSILPDNPKQDSSWHGRISFLHDSMPEVTAIALFDETGNLIYSTAGSMKASASAIIESDWFIKAREREGSISYFSRPHVQALFENQYAYVITIARGLRYEENGQQRLGVMLMDINYTQFSRLLKAISLGSSGYAFVVGPDNSIISHPFQSQIDLGLYQEDLSPIAEAVIGLEDGKKDGRDCVYILHSLDRTRWRMVGIAFVDEILEMQSAFRRILLVALLSAALLAAGIALVMVRLITRPLTVFEDTMLRVQHGDLNATMREDGFREIRLVSSGFNAMLERLKALMDRIVLEQEKKRLYELNALQAQINPHFLYNTLDSIIWMQERGKSQEAIVMVSALAKLFRISISKGRNEITVREELEHVRNYLIIQKMRFKDKFEYSIEAEDDALPLRTVKLIVQPLVENALNHAIDETLGEQLHIHVKSYIEGDSLYFSIADDGVGIPENKLQSLLSMPAGTSGIGLRNVHERLQLTYGKQYGLTIHSREDEGTTVIVHLPATQGGSL